jgi:hypothetical protein
MKVCCEFEQNFKSIIPYVTAKRIKWKLREPKKHTEITIDCFSGVEGNEFEH